jgi:acetylornithine deacetylase
MSTTTATCWESVDAAIDAGAEEAFCFLERLVAEPSNVGQERGAQELVADELGSLGFGVSRLEIPAETAAGAPGGVAQAPYLGRPNVLGRINPGKSPSLLLNGHIDVVPAETAAWSSDPFTPARSDGWLSGRGAGDVKAGFAMGAAGHPRTQGCAAGRGERRARLPQRDRGGVHG